MVLCLVPMKARCSTLKGGKGVSSRGALFPSCPELGLRPGRHLGELALCMHHTAHFPNGFGALSPHPFPARLPKPEVLLLPFIARG